MRAFALLSPLTAAVCVVSLVLIAPLPHQIDRSWMRAVLLGWGTLGFLTWCLDKTERTARADLQAIPASRRPKQRLLTSSVLLLLALIRATPFMLPDNPTVHGFIGEEYQNVLHAHRFLRGFDLPLLYAPSTILTAWFTALFGGVVAPLRIGYALLSWVRDAAFFLVLARMVPREYAALAVCIFATLPMVSVMSINSDEVCSFVLAIQTFFTVSVLLLPRAKFLCSFLVGALAGISLLEYAALKQNSVVALAAVGVHGTIGWWRARRTYQGFARFGLFLTELPLRLLIVGTSAFVVAYPIVAGLGHGDRAFFDGRPISVALERVAQPVTWHELSRGFLLHWRVLTEPNGDTFHTGSVDFPVLNALWFLLLPVLASLVSILNRLRPPAGRVDVRPTLALACIGILSSLYCVVFYRETSFGGYRFLFLVPPLVFASLHCAGAVYFILNSLFSHSRIFRYLQAMSALAVLYIAFENHQQFITYLHAPSTRAAYKSKLSELCPALEALPPSTRVAFVSPLLGNEVFFGDTAVDHWVQKPSEFGYDSVHCRYADPIPFIKTPGGVKQVVETPWIEPHDSKNFDILVFQARYRDASELMHDDHGTILTQRLHEAFNELEAAAGDVQIERSRCSSVAGSAWYRFALCPLRR